jgi:hypothetical protein
MKYRLVQNGLGEYVIQWEPDDAGVDEDKWENLSFSNPQVLQVQARTAAASKQAQAFTKLIQAQLARVQAKHEFAQLAQVQAQLAQAQEAERVEQAKANIYNQIIQGKFGKDLNAAHRMVLEELKREDAEEKTRKAKEDAENKARRTVRVIDETGAEVPREEKRDDNQHQAAGLGASVVPLPAIPSAAIPSKPQEQQTQPPILPMAAMAGMPQAASAAAAPREEKREDNQYQAAARVNPAEQKARQEIGHQSQSVSSSSSLAASSADPAVIAVVNAKSPEGLPPASSLSSASPVVPSAVVSVSGTVPSSSSSESASVSSSSSSSSPATSSLANPVEVAPVVVPVASSSSSSSSSAVEVDPVQPEFLRQYVLLKYPGLKRFIQHATPGESEWITVDYDGSDDIQRDLSSIEGIKFEVFPVCTTNSIGQHFSREVRLTKLFPSAAIPPKPQEQQTQPSILPMAAMARISQAASVDRVSEGLLKLESEKKQLEDALKQERIRSEQLVKELEALRLAVMPHSAVSSSGAAFRPQEPQPPILPMATMAGIPQAAAAAAPREEKRDDNQYQAASRVNPAEELKPREAVRVQQLQKELEALRLVVTSQYGALMVAILAGNTFPTRNTFAGIFSSQKQAASAVDAIPPDEEKRDDNQYQAAAARADQFVLSIFLNKVVNGQRCEAEEMLKANRALALVAGDVTDHAGRTFHNITGFQYAVWALDWHMWTKIKKYLPQGVAQEQARGFTEGSWVRDHGECAVTILQTLLNNYENYYRGFEKANNRIAYWIQQIGGVQRLLPVHVFQEFHVGDGYSRLEFGREDTTLGDGLPSFWPLVALLGKEYALVGDNPCIDDSIYDKANSVPNSHYDMHALASLTSTRTNQRDRLVAELRNSSVPRPRVS